MNQQAISITLFSIGAIMLAVHLFNRFVNGYGGAEAVDAIGVLLVALVANQIWGTKKDQ